MNSKSKEFPHCPDCGFPMLPKPTEYRDGCLVRPLVCLVCDCEKDILDIVIIQPKADDRPGTAAQS